MLMNGIICLLAMGLIVRLLACQMVMTTLPTMKTQVQRAKMVKENCTHQKSTSYLPYNAIILCYRQLIC
ncbi:hypothetical protein CK203_034014 [Vitis vinifera]|uniref:Secreted protein n=1 Tax=Vitis vinifera TaxID=29760 RepID=A0A438IB67_VITVI|nr:hypothetical protein CK203_034014 [Vitis vinifera]